MSTEGRADNGRFVEGTSGNPAGRPRGSRNRATVLMERLLDGEAEELTRKTVDLAKAGDTRALALCLDRLMPPRKDAFVCFDFRLPESSADVPLALLKIIAAISEGK